jgi:hypothetical protein
VADFVFNIAKGRVVAVRPFHGPHGLEWQAGLATVARTLREVAPVVTAHSGAEARAALGEAGAAVTPCVPEPPLGESCGRVIEL